jgi:NDP-sugar pyrophosphorylase family protein
MKALVLSAGKSTRIQSAVKDIPKPLIEIGGASSLVWNLRWLVSQGIKDIWINLHYRGDLIEKKIGEGSTFGARVQYSREDPILGTAGAVLRLKNEWDEPFLVVYGDNIVQFSIEPMLKKHRESQSWASIAVYHVEKNPNCRIAGGRLVLNDQNQVVEFKEGQQIQSPWVNAGVYVLSPPILGKIPSTGTPDFGKDIFPLLLQEKQKIMAYPIEGCCLAIDTPEAYQRAQEIIQQTSLKLP